MIVASTLLLVIFNIQCLEQAGDLRTDSKWLVGLGDLIAIVWVLSPWDKEWKLVVVWSSVPLLVINPCASAGHCCLEASFSQ